MAAERKLKAEIERTLKKVQEGQEIFDDIWNQYSAHRQAHDLENQNQREKLEGELKKEIKKLQRLREQIKGWIAGADIKDKQPLIDARKSIERDMERFKACEKESKAKGAVAGGGDRDPKQRAKDEARDWINTVVDQLTEKVETMEAEMEELAVTVKKRQKPPARLTALEETVGRHKDHIDRLEKVLRCIDNETIQSDELSDLKSDMDMYLGAEDGEDDGMDMGNVDEMYIMFADRLDAVDNAAPAAPLHVKHSKGAREKEAEEAREKERERERAAAAAAKAQLIAQGNTNLKLHDDDDRRPPAGPPAKLTSSGPAAAAAGGVPAVVPPLTAPTPTVGPAGARQTAPTTPIKEPDSGTVTPRNAFPSGGLPPPSPGPAPSEPASSPMPPPRPAPPPGMPAPPGIPPPGMGPPGPSQQQQQPIGAPQLPPGAPPRTPQAAAPLANGGSSLDVPLARGGWLAAAAGAPGGGVGAHAGDVGDARGPGQGPADSQASAGPGAIGQDLGVQPGGYGPPGDRGAAAGPAGPATVGPVGPPGSQAQQQAGDNAASRAASMGLGPGPVGPPAAAAGQQGGAAAGGGGAAGAGAGAGALAGMALGGLPVDLPAVQPAYSAQSAKAILDACYARGVMPQLSDTEWKHYRPRHPVAVPQSYPRSPPEVIDNPNLFRKMDPECLFFAFYFQPNTYQQFLAAHELKRQSWRFHRHHNAWFQRFTEPTVTSDEYEQGAYVYFDYNIVHDDMQTGWCYRRKENFTFRYDALEDELRVIAPAPGPVSINQAAMQAAAALAAQAAQQAAQQQAAAGPL